MPPIHAVKSLFSLSLSLSLSLSYVSSLYPVFLSLSLSLQMSLSCLCIFAFFLCLGRKPPSFSVSIYPLPLFACLSLSFLSPCLHVSVSLSVCLSAFCYLYVCPFLCLFIITKLATKISNGRDSKIKPSSVMYLLSQPNVHDLIQQYDEKKSPIKRRMTWLQSISSVRTMCINL